MNKSDFIAELNFLHTEKSGRKNYAKSGYRPHIQFENYPEYLTSGQQTYIGINCVYPGETVKAEIGILSTEYFIKRLFENMKFEFFEGFREIGSGKILKITNSNLKSDPNINEELINLNFYPKDIIEKIKTIYGSFKTDFKIISELQNLIISEKDLRNPRIIRSMIYLFTVGKMERKKVFEIAKTDWRDILYYAEYNGNEKQIRNFNNEFGKERIKASR